jgi:hypothetical protein
MPTRIKKDRRKAKGTGKHNSHNRAVKRLQKVTGLKRGYLHNRFPHITDISFSAFHMAIMSLKMEKMRAGIAERIEDMFFDMIIDKDLRRDATTVKKSTCIPPTFNDPGGHVSRYGNAASTGYLRVHDETKEE